MSHLLCRPWRLAAIGLTLLTGPVALAQVSPAAPVTPVTPAAPAQEAPTAKTILDQAVAAHQALKMLSATISVETTGESVGQSQTITLAFQKLGGASAKIADKTGPLAQIVSDGKTLAIYDVHAKKYVKGPLPAGTAPMAAVFSSAHAILPMMMARPEGLAQNFDGARLKTTLSNDTLNGVAVDVITVMVPSKQPITLALSIGHDDHLLRRIAETVSFVRGGKTQRLAHTETVTDLSTTPTLTASDFAFTPPPGAKKAPAQAAQPPMHDPRLKVGARPFAIATKDIAGKPISLAQYRGKVVLMDFWATWCGPCVGEMPNVIAAYKKYHAQGFDVLGISLDQERGALTSFVKQNKMPWRQVFDGKGWGSAVPRQYGVMAIPFGLLIGRDGRIVGVEVRGPDLAPAIQKALAQKQASAQ